MIFGWFSDDFGVAFSNPQGTRTGFQRSFFLNLHNDDTTLWTHKTHKDLMGPSFAAHKDHDTTLSSSSSPGSYQEMWKNSLLPGYIIFSAGTIILQQLIRYICHNIYLYTMCYFLSTAVRFLNHETVKKIPRHNHFKIFTGFFPTCWYPSKKNTHTSGLLLSCFFLQLGDAVWMQLNASGRVLFSNLTKLWVSFIPPGKDRWRSPLPLVLVYDGPVY